LTSALPDFYLISTETYNKFEPRACYIEKRIPAANRQDDFMLVWIEPEIYGIPFGIKNDIEEVVLATRLEGQTLFPINEWPLYVYVCHITNKNWKQGDSLTGDDLAIILWGEIYMTKDEAESVARRYWESME